MWRLAVAFACAACGRIGLDTGRLDTNAPDARAPDAPPPSPPRFVQHSANDVPAGASLAAPFAQPVGAGDLVIAAFDYAQDLTQNIHVATVVDSVGDTFALVGPHDGTVSSSADRQYIAYAISAGGASVTVTVTLDGVPTGYFELRVHDYAGASASAPLDAAASGAGTATGPDAAQSAALATSEPNELVFAMVIDGSVSVGTGFTLRGNDYGDVTEDLIAAVPGSYAAVATPTSSWVASVAAFRGQ